MGTYANRTDVSSEKSRAEIERLLTRYGASEFAYGSRADCALIGFSMAGRQIRFMLPLPDRASEDFTHYWRGSFRYERSADSQAKQYEQAIRQRWRALALVIKAKLEAVESGITEFEDEFLAHIVLPNGQTMGQLARPQLQIAYERGEVPPLLGYDG